eukprot:4953193-Prymnesium_polylepis.1
MPIVRGLTPSPGASPPRGGRCTLASLRVVMSVRARARRMLASTALGKNEPKFGRAVISAREFPRLGELISLPMSKKQRLDSTRLYTAELLVDRYDRKALGNAPVRSQGRSGLTFADTWHIPPHSYRTTPETN